MRRTSTKRPIWLVLTICLGLITGLMDPAVGQAAAVRAVAPPGFNYADFGARTGFNLVRNSHYAGSILRLNTSSIAGPGSAWAAEKQPVQTGFVTTFQFRITDLVGTGADGFAFVIQNAAADALGLTGCGIGYGGIPNSLVVEFDTYVNDFCYVEVADPNDNHISVHSRGTEPNDYGEPTALGSAVPSFDLSDGSIHTVTIAYEPGTLQVFLDYDSSPLLTVSVDLASTLALDGGRAWIGFTAASEGYAENHDILSWTFTPQDATQPAPNLTLAPADLVFNTTTPGPGEGLTIDATIHNSGPVTVAAAALDLTDGSAALGQTVTVNGPIVPYGQRVVTLYDGPAPATTGVHTLCALLETVATDPPGAGETALADNQVCTTVVVSDPLTPNESMTVEVPELTAWRGASASLVANVTNNGNAPFTISSATIAPIDGMTAELRSDLADEVLNPGDARQLSFVVTVPPDLQLPSSPFSQTLNLEVATASGGFGDTAVPLLLLNEAPKTLQVRIENPQGQPLEGAMVLIDGDEQVHFTAANGTVMIPTQEGVRYVFTFMNGFRADARPVVVRPASVTSVTIPLLPGEILVSDVTASLLSAEDVAQRGIQLTDPENFQVFDFTVFLNIVPQGIVIPNVILPRQPTAGTVVDLPLTSAGASSSGGGNGGSPSPGIDRPLVAGRLMYLSATQRVETWIVIPGQFRLLRQFWEATVSIKNAAVSADPDLIQLIDVQARLERSSLNLALPPLRDEAQAVTQSIGNIPAGSSASAKWVLRGDASGLYKLSAAINAELQFGSNPNRVPMQMETRQTTVAIYQPALSVAFRAPSQVVAGRPFDLELVVTNATPIMLHGVTLMLTSPMINAHLAQGESTSKALGSLAPNQQHSVRVRVVPEVTGCVNIPASFVAADREISPRLRFLPSPCAVLPPANPSCLYYDFTTGEAHHLAHHFVPEEKPVAKWPSQTSNQGWESWKGPVPQSTGRVAISRGISNDAYPLFYTSTVPRAPEAAIDAELLEQVVQAAVPVEQIRVEYAWVASPPESPLPASAVLNASFTLQVPDGNGTKDITGQRAFTPGEPTSTAESGEERFVGILPISEADRTSALLAKGLRIRLQAQNTNEIIRLKRVGLCYDVEPAPIPPLPPGAEEACDNLLANLRTRKQPFGPVGFAQEEFPSGPQFGSITLEPYPEYRLDLYATDYPRVLTYTGLSADPAYAVIPCVFKTQDGEFYNPTQVTDPVTGEPVLRVEPVVRFTANSPDPELNQWLVLLNYAGYFSVGSPNWCYPGDNVYANFYQDKTALERFGPGYNVPSPRFICSPLVQMKEPPGPCGSFIGSVYRAMGFYNVDAIAAAVSTPTPTPLPEDSPQAGKYFASRLTSLKSMIGGLYYGPQNYDKILPRNLYPNLSLPEVFVGVDPTLTQVYVPVPIRYSGLTIYPHGDRIVVSQDPVHCNRQDPACMEAVLSTGSWIKPLDLTVSTRHQGPPSTPQALWERIKPGDLAITVVSTTTNAHLTTHIAVVVGWGPKAEGKDGADVRAAVFASRYAREFYPTYDSIPNNRGNYVPYVMDRYTLAGTGKVTGPRPFNYGVLHTSTDIWIGEDPAQAGP